MATQPTRPKKLKAPPMRLVTVRFLRAERRGRVGGQWQWPADGAVGRSLLTLFDAGEQTNENWPLATYWGQTHLIEAHVRTAPLQFGVGTVRGDRLPLVLREGARRGEALQIGERDRLLEPSYLTFFGDRIVALVKHSQTPGHRMCAEALAQLTSVDLELIPIPRPNILQAVQQGHGVSTFDITVAAGSIDAAAEDDDLVRATEQLRQATPGADKLRVTLSAQTAVDQRRLRARAIRMLQRRGLDGLDGARARVLTDDAGSELIDLMESDITARARVEVLAKMRHLTPEEAHTAARQGFAQQQTAITRSIGLSQ